jgi:hypothetical protein
VAAASNFEPIVDISPERSKELHEAARTRLVEKGAAEKAGGA